MWRRNILPKHRRKVLITLLQYRPEGNKVRGKISDMTSVAIKKINIQTSKMKGGILISSRGIGYGISDQRMSGKS